MQETTLPKEEVSCNVVSSSSIDPATTPRPMMVGAAWEPGASRRWRQSEVSRGHDVRGASKFGYSRGGAEVKRGSSPQHLNLNGILRCWTLPRSRTPSQSSAAITVLISCVNSVAAQVDDCPNAHMRDLTSWRGSPTARPADAQSLCCRQIDGVAALMFLSIAACCSSNASVKYGPLLVVTTKFFWGP